MGARLIDKRCGYCNGTGKVEKGDFITTMVTCSICRGHRVVRVPSNYRRCPQCNGAGRRDVGEFFPEVVRCKECQGTGWAPPPPEYR